MKFIRWFIGRIILMFDFIFSPRSPKRSTEQQAKVVQSVSHLSLYQLPACPFCVKVRRSMKRNGLPVELRNINQNEALRNELIEKGGKRTVPCLKIEENGEATWLYESSDIIKYLEKFVPEAKAA